MARFLSLLCFAGLLSSPLAGAEGKPWTEVRSPHFRVITDGSEKDARRVAREFEQMRMVFAVSFPNLRLESEAPLLVLAARDEGSMKTLAPQLWKLKGAKPAGLFHQSWEKEHAVLRLDQIGPEAYQVVYHEYVHSLLHLNFRWLPVWLDEGLAEFYGNSRFEQARILVGAPSPRMRVLWGKPLIPVDTLLSVNQSSPYYHDEDKVQTFYAESWALIHFFTFGPGMEQGKRLQRFFGLLQQGSDQKGAFQQVFGDGKELQKGLEQYLRSFTLNTWVIKNPPNLDEKDFVARLLTMAETDAELGSYYLWIRENDTARAHIEQALKADPGLGLAHEDIGFLRFAEGKDDEAAREFARALELDAKLYLSAYYGTMLTPMARSDAPLDQVRFRDALLTTLRLNPKFAPALVQLARLYVRQGDLTQALAAARKAEDLEPSRAGYHLLTGRVALRMGRGAEAAVIARYVADRWVGPDRDEAVELWNAVPAAERPPGDLPPEAASAQTQTIEGRVQSVTCGEKGEGTVLVLDHQGQSLTFHGKGRWLTGFSDTVWYGADHFTFCYHVGGMWAVLRYTTPPDKSYAGDLVLVGLREDLPRPPAAAKAEPAGQKSEP